MEPKGRRTARSKAWAENKANKKENPQPRPQPGESNLLKDRNAPQRKKDVPKFNQRPNYSAGEVLKEISLIEIDDHEIDIDISNHKPTQVSSYSINFTSDPFIVIPAQPGAYRKPNLPLNLSSELQGPTHPDYQHKFFTYPFEAMLVALESSIDGFNIGNYDLLTDRSSLRQLYNWATSPSRNFNIDFEKYNNSLLMRRPDYVERSDGAKNFATSFERHCTNNFNSKSDYFISEFMLGKKKVLMRFEVDAILEDSPKKQYSGSNVPFYTSSPPKPPFKFVELKTYMKKDVSQACQARENKTTWFQSYIAGVELIVQGFKEEVECNICVTEITHKTLSELIDRKTAQRGMQRVLALLNLIHAFMAEKESGTKVSLIYETSKKGLLTIINCNSRRSFVPPNYPFKETTIVTAHN